MSQKQNVIVKTDQMKIKVGSIQDPQSKQTKYDQLRIISYDGKERNRELQIMINNYYTKTLRRSIRLPIILINPDLSKSHSFIKKTTTLLPTASYTPRWYHRESRDITKYHTKFDDKRGCRAVTDPNRKGMKLHSNTDEFHFESKHSQTLEIGVLKIRLSLELSFPNNVEFQKRGLPDVHVHHAFHIIRTDRADCARSDELRAWRLRLHAEWLKWMNELE